MLQILWIEARHLEIHVGHAHVAELRDAADQIVVAPDRQTAVDVEAGARLAAIGFLYAGIPRIGQDKETLFALLQRLFERGDEVRGCVPLADCPNLNSMALAPHSRMAYSGTPCASSS